MRRFKACSRCVEASRWWGSVTMVPAEKKAKDLSSVNHTTKTIHHHHHHHHHYHQKLWKIIHCSFNFRTIVHIHEIRKDESDQILSVWLGKIIIVYHMNFEKTTRFSWSLSRDHVTPEKVYIAEYLFLI